MYFIILPKEANFNEKLSPADRRTFSILLTNQGEKVFYEGTMQGSPRRSVQGCKTGFNRFFHIRAMKE